jgi:hypothetical protein
MAKRHAPVTAVPRAGAASNVGQLSIDFLKRYAVMADGSRYIAAV